MLVPRMVEAKLSVLCQSHRQKEVSLRSEGTGSRGPGDAAPPPMKGAAADLAG